MASAAGDGGHRPTYECSTRRWVEYMGRLTSRLWNVFKSFVKSLHCLRLRWYRGRRGELWVLHMYITTCVHHWTDIGQTVDRWEWMGDCWRQHSLTSSFNRPLRWSSGLGTSVDVVRRRRLFEGMLICRRFSLIHPRAVTSAELVKWNRDARLDSVISRDDARDLHVTRPHTFEDWRKIFTFL